MTTAERQSFNLRRWLFSAEGAPTSWCPSSRSRSSSSLIHADPVIVFFASALGVIPTAALMGRATEELAERSGPGIGGLLNVTFGNAPELIIALFALNAGLHEVVKASIIGSIMGNALLVLGASAFIGGLRRERQRFDLTAAVTQSAMLLLATVALVMPAVFELVEASACPARTRSASTTTRRSRTSPARVLVLIGTTPPACSSPKTHRDLFNPLSTTRIWTRIPSSTGRAGRGARRR